MPAKQPRRKEPEKKTLKVVVKHRHTKSLGKAPILSEEQFDRATEYAAKNQFYGDRDALFVMLSRFCGLRAKEIATLHYEDISDVEGTMVDHIRVSKRGTKGGRTYGKERVIGMPEEVREAMRAYVTVNGITEGPIFWSHRGTPATSDVVQHQLKAAYKACGFKGARSHSGRRTIITVMAHNCGSIGASLDDVKQFAGHSRLETTAGYIERSPNADKLQMFMRERTRPVT